MNAEYLFKNKSEKRYLLVKGSSFNSGQRVLFILNDITKMKKMEKRMKNLRSLYFSQITHEIKTPLISILPLLERLENYIKEERGKKLLKVVRNSAYHLQHISDNILDMTRIEHDNF